MSNVMRDNPPKPSGAAFEDMSDVKKKAEKLHEKLVSLESEYGARREFSIAKTKLEEASMWAVKGIAIADQEARNV